MILSVKRSIALSCVWVATLGACGSAHEHNAPPRAAHTSTPAVLQARGRNGFALAELLNANEGNAAVSAYRRALQGFCTANEDAPWTRILHLGNESMHTLSRDVCSVGAAESSVEALASGNLVTTDEVLLRVSSGEDGAAGSFTLALMRKRPNGEYVPVIHMEQEASFRALARVTRGDQADAVIVCTQRGSQGEYSGDCGVVTANGITRLVTEADSLLCGDRTTLALRGVEASAANGLVFQVAATRQRRTRASDDEGEICSEISDVRTEVVRVPVEFTASGFRIRGALPPALLQAYEAAGVASPDAAVNASPST